MVRDDEEERRRLKRASRATSAKSDFWSPRGSREGIDPELAYMVQSEKKPIIAPHNVDVRRRSSKNSKYSKAMAVSAKA